MGVKFKAMTTIDKPDYVDRFLIKTSALSKAFGTKYIPDKDVCHWLVPGEGFERRPITLHDIRFGHIQEMSWRAIIHWRLFETISVHISLLSLTKTRMRNKNDNWIKYTFKSIFMALQFTKVK